MSNYTRLVVYVVREDPKDKNKSFWSRVGAAFPHKEGDGFNIELDALPVNGRLVVLPPKEEDNQPQQTQPTNNRNTNRR